MRDQVHTSDLGLYALLVGLLVASCGDPFAPEIIEETDFAASLGIDLSKMTRTATGLYIEEIEVGTGRTAGAGDVATVSYTGLLSNAATFAAGTFSFTLGSGGVIPGFDEGVTGMRVGGTRRIVIPPELGYGNSGSGSIPPGSILIFRIHLDALDSGLF